MPLPQRLSQTGAFKDIQRLIPAEGALLYELNVPFWSDGADKHRWIALPRGETIVFSQSGHWVFPAGTVFIKHFEWPDPSRAGKVRRLETRLLVCKPDGGVYGAGYKWRDDRTDADLVREPTLQPTQAIASSHAGGQSDAHRHEWYYPGLRDCQTCHTPQAGYVLGLSTRQLNREVRDPSTGTLKNQLQLWFEKGMLNRLPAGDDFTHLEKLAPADDAARSVEDRVRSWLDANCAQCHRPGGAPGSFDARYCTPLPQQNLIDAPVLIDLGIDHARLIAPRDPWRSILLARILTLDQPKMPPLAHQGIDVGAANLLRQWIMSLPGPDVLPPPTIEPAGGQFSHPLRITLRHPDPKATIRYTLDGSVPGKSSPIYQHPLAIDAPTTVRARAYKPNFTRSITAQETFVLE